MAGYQVGVVFGGKTPEHEVSIVTALQVMNFLSKKHTVVPIYITPDGRWLTGQHLSKPETYQNFDFTSPHLQSVVITPDSSIRAISNPLAKGLFKKPEEFRLDVVFPAMHGPHGEDGTVQGVFELADLPYVGPDHISSAICIDKMATKLILRGAGIPVVDGISFMRLDWESREDEITADIEARFAYPMVVKPVKLGSSIAVKVVHDNEDLRNSISVASTYDTKVIVETCITNKLEINCSVLGYQDVRTSLCEQPLSAGNMLSFEDKYLQGSSTQGMQGAKRIIPAPITDEMTRTIQDMAVQAFRAVGARGVVRIDFLIDQNNGAIYVNEINTIPGSIAYYLWEPSGLGPEQLVEELLEIAMLAHSEKRRSNYSQGPTVLKKIDLLRLRKD